MNKNIFEEKLEELKVGTLEFDGRTLDVYRDLNDPLFLVQDVAKILGWHVNDYYIHMLSERCELDEVVNLIGGAYGPFVTEVGLYNIFSQEHGPLGRKWRRVVHDEIVKTRKQRGMSIIEKFDEWDDMLDTLYFDEETGILIQSVTLPGGDVEQVPYKED